MKTRPVLSLVVGGFEVRPLTPGLARGTNQRWTDGVLVTQIREGAAAAEAGIRAC